MIVPIFPIITRTGYVAGLGDGIVTVNGVPQSRKLIVYDAITEQRVQTAYSLDNGRYLIPNLDPNKRYLVVCRPLHGVDEQGVVPMAWDNVLPMNDKTPDEILTLWRQMISD